MPAQDTSAAVRAVGWGFRHAGRSAWAVRGLDLVVQPGERVLVLGASGAGKSTLLHGLAGLLSETDGAAHEGELFVAGGPPQPGRAGMVFQDPETQLVMARAGDDVAFGLENLAVPDAQIWPRVDSALASTGFGYDRDHPTNALSGGEKQRLVLAGIIALRPPVLLLDEPTANLDPAGAALVRATVGALVAESGATMILVEHRVEDWLDQIDRVVVLEPGGGLIADGSPTDVFAAHGPALAERGVWVPRAWSPATSETGTSSGTSEIGAYQHGVRGIGSTSATGDTLLHAHDVRFRYPGTEHDVVAGVNLRVRSGEVVAVQGPNGSGKSTLALMLAGLLAPTSGAVHGGDALTVSARRRERALHRWPASDLVRAVGTVFQDPEHQFWTRSVLDELMLGPKVAGSTATQARQQADELANRLRLEHLLDANPFTLSGGEKRRLSVATALAARPWVLILDEPTFGQDARTWAEIVDLVAALRDAGHGVVCVSHDHSFVDAVADRCLRMERGRLADVTQLTATGGRS